MASLDKLGPKPSQNVGYINPSYVLGRLCLDFVWLSRLRVSLRRSLLTKPLRTQAVSSGCHQSPKIWLALRPFSSRATTLPSETPACASLPHFQIYATIYQPDTHVLTLEIPARRFHPGIL